MGAGNDEALRAMVFQAWNEFIIQYKKDKEMNDAVKEAEKKIQGFMAKQKDGAKSVLARMQGASETGLISSCFQGWNEVVEESKKEKYVEDMMAQKASKLGSFNSRNKMSAMSATEKVAYLQDLQLLQFCYTIIKREVKVEKAKRYFKEKNEKKKQDLIGVKGLFKNFATELETNLKKGTPRLEDGKQRRDAVTRDKCKRRAVHGPP